MAGSQAECEGRVQIKRRKEHLEVSQTDFATPLLHHHHHPDLLPNLCQDLLPESNGNSLVARVPIVKSRKICFNGLFATVMLPVWPDADDFPFVVRHAVLQIHTPNTILVCCFVTCKSKNWRWWPLPAHRRAENLFFFKTRLQRKCYSENCLRDKIQYSQLCRLYLGNGNEQDSWRCSSVGAYSNVLLFWLPL